MAYRTKLPPKRFEKSPLMDVKAKITKAMHMLLKQEALKKDVSISILVLRALQNELLANNSFAAPFEFPTTEMYDDAKHGESLSKLHTYVKNNPGLSVEHFYALRFEMGIPDEKEFLICFSYAADLPIIEGLKSKNGYVGYQITINTKGVLK